MYKRQTVAYLADVYVLSEHRGHGLGVELVREVLEGGEPALSPEVRWLLHTADAQGLYAKLGFSAGRSSYTLMERARAGGPARPPAPRGPAPRAR